MYYVYKLTLFFRVFCKYIFIIMTLREHVRLLTLFYDVVL